MGATALRLPSFSQEEDWLHRLALSEKVSLPMEP